jgi:hypothetical protein
VLIGLSEEIWPWRVQRDSLPTTRRPVSAADGHAAASALAKALAGKSDHSDFVGEHDYWWGHQARVNHPRLLGLSADEILAANARSSGPIIIGTVCTSLNSDGQRGHCAMSLVRERA